MKACLRVCLLLIVVYDVLDQVSQPTRGGTAPLRWSLGRASLVTWAAPPASQSDAPPPPPPTVPPPPPPSAPPLRAPLPQCTMQQMWRVDMGKCVDASPVLACRAAAVTGDGRGGQSIPVTKGKCIGAVTVYVGSHAGLVKAVDLASGSVLWQAPLLHSRCLLLLLHYYYFD